MKRTDKHIHIILWMVALCMVVAGILHSCTDDLGIEVSCPTEVVCFTAALGSDSIKTSTRSTIAHLCIVEEEWQLEGMPADVASLTSRATLTELLEGTAGVIAYNGDAILTDLNNKEFSFNGDELNANSPIYWKNIETGLSTMDVYAYAPYDKLNGAITGKTFTYTVPTTAAEQLDIIVAKSTVANTAFRKTIPLTFTHALTAVQFKLGSDIIASNVESITISGVHNSGNYTIGGEWNGQSPSGDVSYTVTADDFLMLMPQTLPDDAEVTLTFKDNTTPAISASLKGQKWEEGKLITYTLHKSTPPTYIYLDLAAGNVTINAKTYSGARYEKTGESDPVLVVKTDDPYEGENVVFYVYQSTETTRTSGKGIIQDGKFISPGYDQVKHGTQLWRDYITNNTDVDGVIENWVTDATNAKREGTKNRIQVNAAANTSYNLVIDNVYSTYQTQSQHRVDGGISFEPETKVGCTLTVNTVGDNRLGNIHYYNEMNNGSKIIFEGEGSLTVADVDGLKQNCTDGTYSGAGYYSNHYCSAIGGNDDAVREICYGIVINSGILFAGSTVAENCSAIGGGGNGLGEVTINGGVVTAVAATTGTAIGGGIGFSSNGGKGIVTINGGNVYAYNLDNMRGIPSSAIGGAGSSRSTGTEGVVMINGGYVYAYSALGTAIGGGSSKTQVGGNATVTITGGTVIAKSGAGAGIGGGSACTGGSVSEIKNGGNAIIKISGNPIIRTGSIGGGLTNGAPGSKIGYADITVDGGDTQAQFVLAAGSGGTPTFDMTGGTIRNSDTSDKEYFHIRKQGGAVWLEDGQCAISGGIIENCTATEGGAIYIAGINNPTFTMTGGAISNCASKEGNGGAVYLEGGTVTLSGGTISDNLAQGGNGGGIYIKEGSFFMPAGSTASIAKNSAMLREEKGGNGGGLYVTSDEKDVTVNILSGNITHNTSDSWGGGACVDMSGTAQAANVTVGIDAGNGPDISYNHTLFSGGGLYVSGTNANITINGGKIKGNSTSAYVPNVDVANEGGMVTLNEGVSDENVPCVTVTFHSNYDTDYTKTLKIVTSTNSLLVDPEIIRTGYKLKEWNTRADGKGEKSYQSGDVINIPSNIDLYAQWELQ